MVELGCCIGDERSALIESERSPSSIRADGLSEGGRPATPMTFAPRSDRRRVTALPMNPVAR